MLDLYGSRIVDIPDKNIIHIEPFPVDNHTYLRVGGFSNQPVAYVIGKVIFWDRNGVTSFSDKILLETDSSADPQVGPPSWPVFYNMKGEEISMEIPRGSVSVSFIVDAIVGKWAITPYPFTPPF